MALEQGYSSPMRIIMTTSNRLAKASRLLSARRSLFGLHLTGYDIEQIDHSDESCRHDGGVFDLPEKESQSTNHISGLS